MTDPDVLACRLCGGTARFRFGRTFEAGVPARYFECGDCGLLQSTHLDGRSAGDLRRLYVQPLRPTGPGTSWRQYCVATRLRALGRLGLVPDGAGRPLKILDVGCGRGWLLDFLAFRGHAVVGYDPLEDPGAVPFPVHRDWDAVAPHGPFDLILCTEVFEHWIDARGEIDRIGAVLAPAGSLYVTTELYDTDRCDAGWPYLGESGQHVSFYARRTHRWIARRLGARALCCGGTNEWLYCRRVGLCPPLAALGLRVWVRCGLAAKFDSPAKRHPCG